MDTLYSTFIERQGEWVQLLVEHVQISMIALFIAILRCVRHESLGKAQKV